MENICCICLEQPSPENTAFPNICQHAFCITCINRWTKQENFCPRDYKRFDKIIIPSTGESIKVKPKKKRKKKELYDFSTHCEICLDDETEKQILLCDSCDLGFHIKCLKPPLKDIPKGSWDCPTCRKVDQRRKAKNYMTKEAAKKQRGRPHLKKKSSDKSYSSLNENPHASQVVKQANDCLKVSSLSEIENKTNGIEKRKRGRPRLQHKSDGSHENSLVDAFKDDEKCKTTKEKCNPVDLITPVTNTSASKNNEESKEPVQLTSFEDSVELVNTLELKLYEQNNINILQDNVSVQKCNPIVLITPVTNTSASKNNEESKEPVQLTSFKESVELVDTFELKHYEPNNINIQDNASEKKLVTKSFVDEQCKTTEQVQKPKTQMNSHNNFCKCCSHTGIRWSDLRYAKIQNNGSISINLPLWRKVCIRD